MPVGVRCDRKLEDGRSVDSPVASACCIRLAHICHACFSPTVEPTGDSPMIPIAFWDVSPWGTSSVDPEDAIDNSAMVMGWFPCPCFLWRQQSLIFVHCSSKSALLPYHLDASSIVLLLTLFPGSLQTRLPRQSFRHSLAGLMARLVLD